MEILESLERCEVNAKCELKAAHELNLSAS